MLAASANARHLRSRWRRPQTEPTPLPGEAAEQYQKTVTITRAAALRIRAYGAFSTRPQLFLLHRCVSHALLVQPHQHRAVFV